MANTQTHSSLVVTKFLSDFYQEYVRKSRFAPYTGTTANNIVVIKEGKQKINVPLVTKLTGNGVSGSTTLRGNGEAISNYSFTLTPGYFRHAVEFDREEMEKPNIDLMGAARPLLMDWAMELQRDHIIQACGAIDNGTTYANYGDATAAAHDTFTTNNSDRLLYGASKSNFTAGNHTTSLGTIDTTSDKMTVDMIGIAKRIAQQASPAIRPIRVMGDKEMFVCFHDTYAFRNIAADSTVRQAQREVNGKGDPIFEGGGFLFENVLHIEVPEIADFIDGTSGTNGLWGGLATADGLNTAGASSSRVGVSFLCGQQALGYGLGQRPRIVVDRLHDFEFQPGVAVELKHDIKKAFFNNKQHGVVTIYSSAAVDA